MNQPEAKLPVSAADYRDAAKQFRDVPHYAAAFELAADLIERGLTVSRGNDRSEVNPLVWAVKAFVDKLAA